MKIFTVERIVCEMYEVQAESKEKAKLVISDPCSIMIIKEIIKIKKL